MMSDRLELIWKPTGERLLWKSDGPLSLAGAPNAGVKVFLQRHGWVTSHRHPTDVIYYANPQDALDVLAEHLERWHRELGQVLGVRRQKGLDHD